MIRTRLRKCRTISPRVNDVITFPPSGVWGPALALPVSPFNPLVHYHVIFQTTIWFKG